MITPAKSLTDDELKTLKKKAGEILSICRRNILSQYPFIGSIALRMNMVPVRDIRVRTACTDGNSVYFDIAFLSSLSKEEQTFVLAHEVWHAVLMHLVRRQNRNPEIFNIATDKEVNNLLVNDGFKAPTDLLFPDEDEKGKCAEEIYEMLIKKMKKNKQSMMRMPGQGASGSNQQQQSSSNSSSKSKNNSKNNSSNGGSSDEDGNQQNGQNGNPNGKLSGQFDKHIYDDNDDRNQPNGNNGNSSQKQQPNKNGGNEDSQEGNGNGSGYGGSKITDKYGDVGFDSDYQPKISKDFADKMRETIVAEAQRVEKTKGSLPAHIKELVKRVTTSELKWEELLAQFVTKCYNSGNRSWIPPNRRHVHNGLYLQSRQASKIKLALIIDTSGSTMGDRGKFLAELSGLIKSFGLYELTIIEIDAEIGDIKHYTQDDNLEWEIENENYAMSGGGGTELRSAFEEIVNQQMDVDAVVALTDGYIDNIPENPTKLPTLWVITKDGTEDFCDWGQKIRLKISDNDM